MFLLVVCAVALSPSVRLPVRRVTMSAAPETQTKTRQKVEVKPETKKKVAVAKPERKTMEELEDMPMFKVFLLGDEEYDQTHVCKALMDLIDGMDIKRAEEIYKVATGPGGSALITILDQETAEFVVEQLARRDPMIFAELQEDKDQKPSTPP